MVVVIRVPAHLPVLKQSLHAGTKICCHSLVIDLHWYSRESYQMENL